MKKFLAIYQASPEEQQQMAKATPEQTQAVMAEWMKWKSQNEKHIVDFGAPTMPAAVFGKATMAGNISGYSVLQAESIEELKAAFANHPHQDTEIVECISM